LGDVSERQPRKKRKETGGEARGKRVKKGEPGILPTTEAGGTGQITRMTTKKGAKRQA